MILVRYKEYLKKYGITEEEIKERLEEFEECTLIVVSHFSELNRMKIGEYELSYVDGKITAYVGMRVACILNCDIIGSNDIENMLSMIGIYVAVIEDDRD